VRHCLASSHIQYQVSQVISVAFIRYFLKPRIMPKNELEWLKYAEDLENETNRIAAFTDLDIFIEAWDVDDQDSGTPNQSLYHKGQTPINSQMPNDNNTSRLKLKPDARPNSTSRVQSLNQSHKHESAGRKVTRRLQSFR
jgi:hypothetical protein